jgi:acyl-coenzyme A synthetase/AMP-(fatty) acid ligase
MTAQTIAGLVADRAEATPVARMVVGEKGNHRTFGQIAFESQRVAGGSPRPASLHDEVGRSLGVPVVSGYGMTECPYITWGRWDDSDDDHTSSEGGAGPGGSVIVVRADGTLAAAGEPGAMGKVVKRELVARFIVKEPA